jgi:hypothetical protein
MRNLSVLAAAALTCLTISAAAAQENYESWPVLKNPFPSTGGGGIMIDGYKPVIAGNKCSTDFTATEPGGKVYRNSVAFDAVPVQGGTLCRNGKWRAADGSANGTTPFRVFFKNGVWRASP